MKLREIKKLDKQFREGIITRAKDTPDGTEPGRALYDIAISSEAEVERWWGIEILSHDKGAVDMTRLKRGAAVLIDHYGDQVGVVESARVDDDGVLRGQIRFSRSERGQMIEQDIIDGIRKNISVGYIVRKAQMVEQRDGGTEVWKVTRWQPAEVSIVSVPADVTVGVGRSDDRGTTPVEIEEEPVARTVEPSTREVPIMKKKKVRDERGGIIEVDETDPRPEVRDADIDYRAVEDKRAKDIADGCVANNCRHLAPDLIGSNLSTEQALLRIAAHVATRGDAVTAAAIVAQMPLQDRKTYSYARVILALGENRKVDGFEAEVNEEIMKKMPAGLPNRGGFFIPGDLGVAKRALDTKTTGKGAEVVFEQPGELIELLRNATAVVRLGARTLSGLSAPIAFPKQTGAMAATWVGENPSSDVGATDVTLALALLTHKTLQGSTSYSRQLLLESSIDVEAMVRDELATIHALAIDLAAIHGLGAAGEPTGIYKALNVSATAVGGAMNYAKIVAMEGQVATANALLGALGWLMNPTMSANLKQVVKFSSTASPIWEGPITEGNVDGYRSIATPQVSKIMTGSERTGGAEIGAVFGNWRDLIVATFGAFELIVDPYSLKKRGMIEVTSFQLADVLARHGESFSKATGATG